MIGSIYVMSQKPGNSQVLLSILFYELLWIMFLMHLEFGNVQALQFNCDNCSIINCVTTTKSGLKVGMCDFFNTAVSSGACASVHSVRGSHGGENVQASLCCHPHPFAERRGLTWPDPRMHIIEQSVLEVSYAWHSHSCIFWQKPEN